MYTYVLLCQVNPRLPFEWPPEIGSVPVEHFLEKPTKLDFNDRQPWGPLPIGMSGRINVLKGISTWAKQHGQNAFKQELFGDIDCSAGYCNWMHGKIPCLLYSHPQGPWSIKRGRRLTIQERARFQASSWLCRRLPQSPALPAHMHQTHQTPHAQRPHAPSPPDPTTRLMGLSAAEVATPGLTGPMIGKMLGNSMSVNVLERILSRALLAAGLVKSWPEMVHGWEDRAAAARRARELGGHRPRA